jgi:hypothetical protein
MKLEKRHFVVVLPGDVKVFRDLDCSDDRSWSIQNNIRSMAQAAVWDAKLTTPRKNPQTVKVKVFEQRIQNGQIEEKFIGEFDIQLALERMTDEDYDNEVREITSCLPFEFKGFVENTLSNIERASFEENVDTAREIVRRLAPTVEKYTERILKKG